MSGKLLDTNAVIALQGSDPGILALLKAGGEILVPAIVMGELYYGAFNSGRVTQNVAVVDEFGEANTVLACDKTTARHYGQIRQELKVKGRPIPEGDLWIAALARQHGLTPITRDEHFRYIDGLAVEGW